MESLDQEDAIVQPAVRVDEEYEVEDIVDHKNTDGLVYYRVRWRGYTSDEDTWEPRQNLKHCVDKLRVYETRTGLRQPKGPRYEYVPINELQPKDTFWQNAQRGELPADLANADKYSIVKSRSQKKIHAGGVSPMDVSSASAPTDSASLESLSRPSTKKVTRTGKSCKGKSHESRAPRNELEAQLDSSRRKSAGSKRRSRRTGSASSLSDCSTDYSWSNDSLDDRDGTLNTPSNRRGTDRTFSTDEAIEYEYIDPDDASAPSKEAAANDATTIPKRLATSEQSSRSKAKDTSKYMTQKSNEPEMSQSRKVELLAPYGLVRLNDPAELRTLFELPVVPVSQLEALRDEAAKHAAAAKLSLNAYLNSLLRRAVHTNDFEKLSRLCKLVAMTNKRRNQVDAGSSGDCERLELDFEQFGMAPAGSHTSASVGTVPSESGDEMYSLIQVATLLGDAYAVDLLAQRGANLNAPSRPSGATALMLAAARGFDEIVTLLVSFGAHVNAITRTGESALYRAVRYDRARCAEILLRCGANMNLRVQQAGGRQEMTPLSLAEFVTEKSAVMRPLFDKMTVRARQLETAFADAVRAEVRGALLINDDEKPIFPLQMIAVRDLDSLRDIFTTEFSFGDAPDSFFEDLSYGYVLFIARANLFAEKLELDLGDSKIVDNIDLNCVKQPFITEAYGFAAYSLAPLRNTRNQLTIVFTPVEERRSRLGSVYSVLSLVIGAYKVRLAEQT